MNVLDHLRRRRAALISQQIAAALDLLRSAARERDDTARAQLVARAGTLHDSVVSAMSEADLPDRDAAIINAQIETLQAELKNASAR